MVDKFAVVALHVERLDMDTTPASPKSDASTAHQPDFYLACHCDVRGWGGGLAFAVGLQQAWRQMGYHAPILGIGDDGAPGTSDPRSERINLNSGIAAHWWRIRSWLLPRGLSKHLRDLPPPRFAFVTVSPTWVLAAQHAWPDKPVILVFACLLANCLPFTWLHRRAPSLWTWLDFLGLRRIEKRALTSADLVLAPTQQSVDEIDGFVGRTALPLERCDYGVCPVAAAAEERVSSRRAIGAQADSFVIALIGHCDRNKSFDLAIRALGDVDRCGRLLIVGDGPELEALRALASAEGVANRITFTGGQRQMAPWYAAADAVLSTSFYDTFPNVLLEGMALGLPIIAPQHDPPRVYSGMAEVLRAEACGLLYCRSEPASLSAALNRLISDRRLASDLGERGRRAVQQRFQWSTAAARILRHCGLEPQGTSMRPAADSTRPHSHFGRSGAYQSERKP